MSEIYNILHGTYEHHIMPLFWQKGESKEMIEEYMRRIYDCDIREVIIESRPFPDFCGESWWNTLADIIEIAKQLGMKIWIFDDSHFPTGYANGAMKDHPQQRKIVIKHRVLNSVGPFRGAKFYAYNEKVTRVDGQYKTEKIKDEILGVVAICGETRIDITNKVQGNYICFDVPDGIWDIVIIYKDTDNEFRPDYINMVDKASCDVLIEAVYEAHYKKFKDEFGKTIVGFFTDEPGFANEKGVKNDSLIGKDMPLPWSEETRQRMSEHSDNFLLDLPSLWLDLKDAPMIRHKYMDIVSKLYQECFDENIGTWCRNHHVKHIGHVIEDRDSHARLGMGPGHFFRSMAGQDMAGLDIVINQLVPGIDEGMHFYGRGYWDMEFFNYALVKMGTSLAHIDPIKEQNTMAEVFGAFGWQEGIKNMKWIADHFLVRGTNYFVPHAFSQAPFPDPDCPPHFYAHGKNPQYRYFSILMEYMNKMCSLLSNGHTKPDVAVLYHGDAEWTGDFMLNQKVAKELTRKQIDFDIIPTDVFENPERYLSDVSKGLCINGTTYRCFVIPYCEYIGKSVVDFIINAKELGFPIYIIDELPSHMYDSECDLPDVSHVKVVALSELADTLRNDGIYDIMTSEYQQYLRFLHYEKQDADYYVFTNEDPKHAITTTITANRKMRYRYDVLQGKVYPFNGTLNLQPYESCVIINNEIKDIDVTQQREWQHDMVLETTFQVAYMSAVSYPNVVEMKELKELLNLDDIFNERCGTYRYTTSILLDKNIEQACIDLGDVYEIAQLSVNGKDIGTRICPPYHYDVDNLVKGTNEFIIEVTNKVDKEVKEMLSLHEVMEPSGILGPICIKY